MKRQPAPIVEGRLIHLVHRYSSAAVVTAFIVRCSEATSIVAILYYRTRLRNPYEDRPTRINYFNHGRALWSVVTCTTLAALASIAPTVSGNCRTGNGEARDQGECDNLFHDVSPRACGFLNTQVLALFYIGHCARQHTLVSDLLTNDLGTVQSLHKEKFRHRVELAIFRACQIALRRNWEVIPYYITTKYKFMRIHIIEIFSTIANIFYLF